MKQLTAITNWEQVEINRSFKVSIARRIIRQVKTECEVRMIRKNAATKSATLELKTCDLLVSSTDKLFHI
jgi:molybdopterin/thiamine biosynthesis adenylyltransferase